MDSRSTLTDPRTRPQGPRTDDPTTPQEPAMVVQQRTLGLSLSQVIGSALAAVSGAVLASWLGVTGTLVGAAVGSVMGTVGTATYTYSLRRGREVVNTGLRPVMSGPAGDPLQAPLEAPLEVVADDRSQPKPIGWRQWPWQRLGVAALAALVLGLGTLTLVEVVTGQPVSTIAGGNESGRRTTLGKVFSGGSESGGRDNAPVSPTPSTPVTQEPSAPATTEPSAEPSAEPTESPTPSPEPAPGQGPSEPAPSPTPNPPTPNPAPNPAP